MSGSPALEHLVSVEAVTISFDGTALFEPLSLRVAPGEIVALIGASGVGKTSLLRAICGLLPKSTVRGNLRVAENPAVVFQEDRLLPWCDIISNTLLPINLRRRLTRADVSVARALLDKLQLARAERRLPGEVSGGMRQRVAIARALIGSSPVLLLDEPFTALDFAIKIECQRTIVDHIARHRIACILVTHDIDDAVSLANRIVRLRPYPAPNQFIDVEWQGRIRDPLESRTSVDHFNLVRNLLEDNAL